MVRIGVWLHVHHWDMVEAALSLRSSYISDDGKGKVRAPLLSLGKC